MQTLTAILVIAVIYAVGDVISYKTKALFSMMFVAGLLFLVGFWVGIPATLFADSKLIPVAMALIAMLMVHMGGVAHPDLTRAAIETALAHPNITLVASHVSYTAALKAIETLGPNRVAWGSDSPFGLMRVELAAYRALLRDLPHEAQAQVLGGTIASVLGVPWGTKE